MATKKKPAKKAKPTASKDEVLLKALKTYTGGVADHRGKVIEGDEAAEHEIAVKASELATLLEARVSQAKGGSNE